VQGAKPGVAAELGKRPGRGTEAQRAGRRGGPGSLAQIDTHEEEGAQKLVQQNLVRYTEQGVALRSVRSPRDGSPNPVTLEPDPRLLALARETAPAVERAFLGIEGFPRPPRLVFGTIATGDSFVGSRARKTELRERLSAHAVEMEGTAVGQVCRELGVPFLVVRGLSDRASADASAEARRNLGVAAGNAAEVALAVARRLGREGP
jgi:adenosylhomocysteine nucleosidase